MNNLELIQSDLREATELLLMHRRAVAKYSLLCEELRERQEELLSLEGDRIMIQRREVEKFLQSMSPLEMKQFAEMYKDLKETPNDLCQDQ